MNKNCAFTFLEVLLALFILIASVSIFSGLQFKSLTQVWRGKEDIDRVFLIKKEFLEILLNVPDKERAVARMRDRPIKTVLEDPQTVMISELFDIDKKSSLNKFADSIDIIRTTGEWDSGTAKRNIKFLSFTLKPPNK
jgi:hypothetical protein